jgi:hypothetical protein
MKLSPDLARVQARMQPGVLSLHGFLGTDTRNLADILEADAREVARLGLTHRQIADRLQEFMAFGRDGLGTEVVHLADYRIRYQDARGRVLCPWGHPGLYEKGDVHLTRLSTDQSIVFTELQVHLIGEHGFYEGRGSPYRLDPAALKGLLDL